MPPDFSAKGKRANPAQVGVLGDVLTNAPNVVRKGRLGPGQMVCADLQRGSFQTTQELAAEVAAAHPYAEWLKAR